LVLALVCLAVVSCKKDDDNGNNGNSNVNGDDCLCAENYQFTPNNNPDTSMYSVLNSESGLIFDGSSDWASYSDYIGNTGTNNSSSTCDLERNYYSESYYYAFEVSLRFISPFNGEQFLINKTLIENMKLGEYVIDYDECVLPVYPDYESYINIYIGWEEYYFTNNTTVKMNLKQVEVTDVSTQLNTKYRYFIRMGISIEGLVDENDTTQVRDLNYDYQFVYVDGN
jgi:hypothetical protein